MKKCNIVFPKELCEGYIGSREEVREFLKDKEGDYDYEGIQQVLNRELHEWESVYVYSYATYEGTGFVCYKR